MLQKGILFLILILFIPIVFSSDPAFYLTKNRDTNATFQCTLSNGQYCDNSFQCNWTVKNPGKEIVINNGVFENKGNYYNYQISGALINQEGDYFADSTCTNGTNGIAQSFFFRVNSSGQTDLKNNNIGIYLVMAIIISLYAYFAFKVDKNISKAHLYMQLIFFLAAIVNIIGLLFYGYWDIATLPNKEVIFMSIIISNIFIIIYLFYLIVVKIMMKLPQYFKDKKDDEEG